MELKSAFRFLTGSGLSLPAAVAEINQHPRTSQELNTLLAFLEKPSKMGILIRA